MNTQKNVNQRLSKLYTKQAESKQELSSEKVELAMDFSSILKQLRGDVDKTNKQTAQMDKAAKAFVAASNPDFTGVPSSRAKDVQAFFKDFSKKAADLGIDVKSTQFYKEYQEALDLVSQLEDNAGQYGQLKKLVK